MKSKWMIGLLAVLASCAPSAKIVVATDSTWPPMEFIDDNAALVGFDIDLFTAVCESAGLVPEFKSVAWDGIFAGLDTDEYQVVTSSVTITDERKAKYDFSAPYLQAGQALIVPTADTATASLADLAQQKVGTQINTAGSFEVRKYPDVQLQEYSDVALALQDLVNGNLKAVVCDNVVALNFALTNADYKGKLKIIGGLLTAEDYGFVVKKGSAELLAKINAGLAAVQASGKLDELKAKWGLN